MLAVISPKSDKSDNQDNSKGLGKDFTSMAEPKQYKRRSTLIITQ